MSTLRHPHELRRYERFACPHLAQVLLTDEWRDCRVHDLSGGGAHVVLSERPAIGAAVELHVEAVAQLRGRVVRHTERGFAMQFELSDLWVH